MYFPLVLPEPPQQQQRSEYADIFVPVPFKDKKIRTSLNCCAICIGARGQQTHVEEGGKTPHWLSFGTFSGLFHPGKKESVGDSEDGHERMYQNGKCGPRREAKLTALRAIIDASIAAGGQVTDEQLDDALARQSDELLRQGIGA